MSKMDALRAMREARYEEAAASRKPPVSAGGVARSAAPGVRPTRRPSPEGAHGTPTDTLPTDEASPEESLCGHRSISGRTCTREQGHAATSHRYR
jgi:hypothetical protein